MNINYNKIKAFAFGAIQGLFMLPTFVVPYVIGLLLVVKLHHLSRTVDIVYLMLSFCFGYIYRVYIYDPIIKFFDKKIFANNPSLV